MQMNQESHAPFDIAFVGHYTKDTIVYPNRSFTHDGGAYFFGASVAARMGLNVAVVTRLAQEDVSSYQPLLALGVRVFPTMTPHSTCLRLVYPSDNLDDRTLYVTESAGPFTVREVEAINARAFHIGASMRGEVPGELVRILKSRAETVSLDVQGYARVNRGGVLEYDVWPGKEEVLPFVDVLKADSVEAERLTGESDLRRAASILGSWGPKEVLITHGGGIVLLADGQLYEAPFVTKVVRGRSGRGDTCTAAYLSRRLSAPPADAIIWAAATTSMKLEKEGPFDETRDDVEELIRRKYASAIRH
jgi:sugar/nucleoside kinase (ribokinase family)